MGLKFEVGLNCSCCKTYQFGKNIIGNVVILELQGGLSNFFKNHAKDLSEESQKKVLRVQIY